MKQNETKKDDDIDDDDDDYEDDNNNKAKANQSRQESQQETLHSESKSPASSFHVSQRPVLPSSFIFALRICVNVSLASLFHLIRFFPSNNDIWPDAIWIYVTVTIVSWQPRIDTAAVLRKTVDRTVGTVVGSILGLAIGFLSLVFNDLQGQSIFLGFMVGLHGFVYPYVCDRMGLREQYPASLGLWTFGIVVFGFYNGNELDQPWQPGVYRVVNILIGCVISCVTALVVWPVSTRQLFVQDVAQQIQRTGISASLTLQNAVAVLRGERIVPPLMQIWSTSSPLARDDAYTAYVQNIEKWKSCRMHLSYLGYDPWFRAMSTLEQETFRQHMVARLGRSFRIQTNIMSLDAIVRFDDFVYRGPPVALELLESIAQCTRCALDFSIDPDQREKAATDLLQLHLIQLRGILVQMLETEGSSTFSTDVDLEELLDWVKSGENMAGVGIQGEQTMLFFQLVEQLILRVARLHYYCKTYDPPMGPCECWSIW